MLIFSKRNEEISKCFYEHHESVGKCVEKLEEFFTVLFSENPDPDRLNSLKAAIDHFEHDADSGMRDAISLMGEAFLPVTRKNLIALVQSTDAVANKCQAIARRVLLEHIQLPKNIHADILEIIDLTKEQLSDLYNAIDKLLNDFKSLYKDRKVLEDITIEESHIDRIETVVHERIFDMDIPLYEKVYYRSVLENLCNISDAIEDIADQILVIMVEREA